MPDQPLTVLVVDDHPLFRQGVVQLLALDAAFSVVGDTGNAESALALAMEHEPDIVLLDRHMPGTDGIEVLRKLREAGVASRIIMLTVSDDPDDVTRALRLGASGYLLKDMEPEDMLEQLRRALGSQPVVSPSLAGVLATCVVGRATSGDPASTLTRREAMILDGIAEGLSNKAIARRLAIAEGTVKVHVKRLLRKLGLHSRVEAAVWATRRRDH